MKISLVHLPPWIVENPPINIGYLTAYLRENGHEVVPFDFNVEAYREADEDEKSIWRHDLDTEWIKENNNFINRMLEQWAQKILETNSKAVGFTVYEDSRELCLKVAKKIKEGDSSRKIIFGGPECFKHTHLDEIVNSDSVDVIVLGDGEEPLKQIMDRLEGGKSLDEIPSTIVGNEMDGECERYVLKDLNGIPFPDFSDLPLEKYDPEDKKETPILGSRGCPHNCAFCEDANLMGHYRFRSAEDIFKEMELRYEQGFREFFFNDLTMNGNLNQLEKLCDLIIKSDLKGDIDFNGQARFRGNMGKDLLEKMKRAGCITLLYGLESGSQKILDKMGKGYEIDAAGKNLRDTKNAGISTEINLIIGFPGENDETVGETINFLKKNSGFIDRISAIYELEVRPGSNIRKNYSEYGIKNGKEVQYWETENGENTFPWRFKKIYEILKTAKQSGIKIGVDEAHWYFYHLFDYYFDHKGDLEGARQASEDLLEEFSRIRSEMKDRIKELVKKNGRLHEKLNKKNEELESKMDIIDDKTDEIENLEEEVDVRDDEIDGLKNKLYEMNEDVKRLKSEVESKEQEIEEVRSEVESKEEEIEEVRSEVESKEEEIEEIRSEVESKEEELEEVRNSISYRISNKLSKKFPLLKKFINDLLVRENGKRRDGKNK